jgi:hypothetical protein
MASDAGQSLERATAAAETLPPEVTRGHMDHGSIEGRRGP